MSPDIENNSAHERTSLLSAPNAHHYDSAGRPGYIEHDARSALSSHLSKEEQALGQTAVGERLPYNDYTTIDWLHDLVKDSFRIRAVYGQPGLRNHLLALFDASEGWIAVAVIGLLTACVAFLVDIATATVSDWKFGYCRTHPLYDREGCCTSQGPGALGSPLGAICVDWQPWESTYLGAMSIYIGSALAFGVFSASLTMLTRTTLVAADDLDGEGKLDAAPGHDGTTATASKTMYMASGSGIPEIKTILSGFVIPHFLDLKVLVVKAIGAVFAVSTGMCLGKEGPFVHISTCVAYLVGCWIPKYRDNGRKMRELLSAGCASGLSVAFGAPIGGVLFSYEEISTYFPRKVLWRAFLCSLVAAIVLRELNPTGTGKLVLFETGYGTSYLPQHYLVFVLLGVVGGIFGGVFCKINFWWSRHFRKYSIIKNHPVFEVFLVTLITAVLQYPNPLTRDIGDIIIKNLLVDCGKPNDSYVCDLENGDDRAGYIGWLVYGTVVKLVLMIITFGCKVPSGIIIPALDAGAFFGRLVGQTITTISPGIFAMVGAGAFLAGVSRMTISLVVIMFELTGEIDYVVPHMIAILVAKWVADAMEREGVYDLAQTVLGHPFLDPEHALAIAQRSGELTEALVPPQQTMNEITVEVSADGRAAMQTLSEKLSLLQRRGLADAGLVLVHQGLLRGYLAESELAWGLHQLGRNVPRTAATQVVLLGTDARDDELDLSVFVDRTPLTLNSQAPIEYCVEMFGKLGLRYLCVIDEESGHLSGVIIKKRLVMWLEQEQEQRGK